IVNSYLRFLISSFEILSYTYYLPFLSFSHLSLEEFVPILLSLQDILVSISQMLLLDFHSFHCRFLVLHKFQFPYSSIFLPIFFKSSRTVTRTRVFVLYPLSFNKIMIPAISSSIFFSDSFASSNSSS